MGLIGANKIVTAGHKLPTPALKQKPLVTGTVMSKLQQTNRYLMSTDLNGSHNLQTKWHVQLARPSPVDSQHDSSSKAVPPITTQWNHGYSLLNVLPSLDSPSSKPSFAMASKQNSEEIEVINHTLSSIKTQREHDQIMVLQPDIDSPFVDEVDVANRLLPYHLFQQPQEDLETCLAKRKNKITEPDWTEENQDNQEALELFKRREGIRQRWRKLKVRSGKRAVPDIQGYYLAQVVLESDRSENAWLSNELRTARSELERMEREKRATANASRMSHFTATPQPPIPAIPAQYYRGYPYAYTQAYGTAVPPTNTPTFTVAPTPPTNYTPYQTSAAIPVQLPVASLPALHQLGIIPVPTTALPPEGQPQPPAVLRGSTANGTILSLEINVSLLQSSQMSGLASLLNSLVNRNTGAPAPAPSNPQGTTPGTSNA